MKIMGIFLSEVELKINNKHYIKLTILLPNSDGVDEYTTPFRQMLHHILVAK